MLQNHVGRRWRITLVVFAAVIATTCAKAALELVFDECSPLMAPGVSFGYDFKTKDERQLMVIVRKTDDKNLALSVQFDSAQTEIGAFKKAHPELPRAIAASISGHGYTAREIKRVLLLSTAIEKAGTAQDKSDDSQTADLISLPDSLDFLAWNLRGESKVGFIKSETDPSRPGFIRMLMIALPHECPIMFSKSDKSVFSLVDPTSMKPWPQATEKSELSLILHVYDLLKTNDASKCDEPTRLAYLALLAQLKVLTEQKAP